MGFAGVRIKWRIHHQKPLAHETSLVSPATQGTPWQEISLTLYDDSSLSLVLSLHKKVWLETTKLYREAKFLIIEGVSAK